MARLSLSLLGPFQVTLEGKPVTAFASNKVRALLAYLAVEADRPHRRDVLAGLLWPDWPDRSARTNLRNALANLRRCIADHEAIPPHLLADRETIQFNRASDCRLDAAAFRAAAEAEDAGTERLEEALALYRGSFLEGFGVEDSAAYEGWAQQVREGLERLALSALERLVAGYEERGERERAIEAARRQVALAPWQESAHRQLMHLLALSGERSVALAQYEACRQALKQELDVGPSAETTRLYERIRDGEARETGGKRQEAGEQEAGDRKQEERKHNLPAQLIPFVGREETLVEIEERLRDPGCRLLTLVGPGGSGKTRLALEAAALQGDRFAHGVWFVSLAPLQSAEAIVPTIAQAIGFPFYSGAEPKDQLVNYLRSKKALLVLDNYEHLLEGAELVPEILRAAPEVVVLATSRAALNVQGESLYLVSGMDYPALTPQIKDSRLPSPVFGSGAGDEGALQYSAVRLFVDSARRARPDFALTDDNLVDVVRICRLVDGMPLALLLAAAWLKVLAPAEIANQITGQIDPALEPESGRQMTGLDFLASDQRDAPERQRSMRAVFDHSWRLLDARELAVMEALSVFRGGCTREAAQAVAGASLRDLMSLVDRSLLHRVPSGRYEMHELLRQYAAEKLSRSPFAYQVARDAHCAYYAAALARGAANLKGPRQRVALAEMEADLENARAAWQWAVERVQERAQVKWLDQAMGGWVSFTTGGRATRTGKRRSGQRRSRWPVDGPTSPRTGSWFRLRSWPGRATLASCWAIQRTPAGCSRKAWACCSGRNWPAVIPAGSGRFSCKRWAQLPT